MIDLDVHTCIVGTTSSGKTTCAKCLFEDSQRPALFCNYQAEDVRGRRVRRAPSVQDLVRNGKTVWEDSNPDRMPQQLHDLVPRLFALGLKIEQRYGGSNRGRAWLTVFVDEAWAWEPKSSGEDHNPLSRLAAQGYRHGVVLVMITQRPQEVAHKAMTQTSQFVLYRVTQPERDYIEDKIEPVPEADWAWIQQDYHHLVRGPRGWEQRIPLPTR